MEEEYQIQVLEEVIEIQSVEEALNITLAEGLPGQDATINGVTALTLTGGENLTLTQVGNVASLEVDFSSLEEDKTYVHEQLVSSQFWNIQHNLGKHPSVTVIDSGGSVVFGDVEYVSMNEITISFGFPFGGTAYLN